MKGMKKYMEEEEEEEETYVMLEPKTKSAMISPARLGSLGGGWREGYG